MGAGRFLVRPCEHIAAAQASHSAIYRVSQFSEGSIHVCLSISRPVQNDVALPDAVPAIRCRLFAGPGRFRTYLRAGAWTVGEPESRSLSLALLPLASPEVSAVALPSEHDRLLSCMFTL